MGVGGKIIIRIRLTSDKDLVEVEAELGKTFQRLMFYISPEIDYNHQGAHWHLRPLCSIR